MGENLLYRTHLSLGNGSANAETSISAATRSGVVLAPPLFVAESGEEIGFAAGAFHM